MNRHTLLGLPTPFLKEDSPRCIDRVIDYFGGARSPAIAAALRAPESSGDVAVSKRW